jgi:hypothetical protein
MREIKPYQTLQRAKAALDNGGRFFNLLTRASDNRISNVELAKAAGVLRSDEKAFLFLHMALADLPPAQRAEVLGLLEAPTARRFRQHAPRGLTASALARGGKPGDLVVVDGYSRLAKDWVNQRMVPIIVGKVLVPITVKDRYDTYFLGDEPDGDGPAATVIVPHGTRGLAGRRARFGGILRASLPGRDGRKVSAMFLEPVYYTLLDTGTTDLRPSD